MDATTSTTTTPTSMNATDDTSSIDHNENNDLYAAMTYTSPYWLCWLWSSCALSILGSSAILFHIQKRKRQFSDGLRRNSNTSLYHRIMAGISVADCIGTSGYATAVFLVPRASGMALAMGNQTTCRWSGVLQTFVIAPFLYNAELSLYFLLLVRYGWQESAVTKKFGPYVHFGPICFTLLVATLGLTMDVIHPDSFTGLCDLGRTPPGCTLSHCENGDAIAILFPILKVLLLLPFFVGVIATWLVCISVFRQNNRSLRHSFDGQATVTATQRRKVDMTVQAFLYTLAFSVMIVIIGYDNAWEDVSSWSHRRLVLNRCVYHFCVPLQGSLNSIIYFRLRIRSWRQKNPGLSFGWSVWQAVVGGEPEQSGVFSSGSWSHRNSNTATGGTTQPHQQLTNWDATYGSSLMFEPKPKHHDRKHHTAEEKEDPTQSPSYSTPGDDDEAEAQDAAVQRIDVGKAVAGLPLETAASDREEDTEVGVIHSSTGLAIGSHTGSDDMEDASPAQEQDDDSCSPPHL